MFPDLVRMSSNKSLSSYRSPQVELHPFKVAKLETPFTNTVTNIQKICCYKVKHVLQLR